MEEELKVVLEEPERRDYEDELLTIIQNAVTTEELKERLDDYHENDIASVLERLTTEERQKVYKALGMERAPEVFAYVDDMSDYIEEIGSEKVADILESMDADDAVDLLEEMDEEQRAEVESLLDEEAKADIDLITSYDEDEIGSKMTTNYIVIGKNLTIKQAMRALINQAEENDNISTLYVQNEDETFYGAISLNDLIIARTSTALEDLVTTSYPYVYATETISECIEELKDYSEDSIPVLDNNKKILGVITSQDIVEVVDEEMSEDYAKLAGLTADEELNEPLSQSIKKRLPWLSVLLVLSIFVSTIVGAFEGVMKELTLIVSFQSMILGMSGNVGTQSLAITIRVLMDENLTGKQKWHLVGKELRIGFFNGLLLGVVAFVFIGFYLFLVRGLGGLMAFAVSGCIGISLLLAMLISSMVGTSIPLFFHKIKVDPAVASGPLITTVNDLVAVVTYYGLAWLLLINLLHVTGV